MGIRGRSGEEDNRREWGGGDCVLFFLSQKQDRYKVLQGLVDHLDTEIDIKEGLLTTLSNCVTVGADGSIGLPPPPPPLHRPACTSPSRSLCARGVPNLDQASQSHVLVRGKCVVVGVVSFSCARVLVLCSIEAVWG